mmetsp:Transcript_101596/g.152229  ORF Transcript_101596/g.152229 Transcript_101596/m.152229 type:complete len:224 (-) Transcript_101596:152-823(-)
MVLMLMRAIQDTPIYLPARHPMAVFDLLGHVRYGPFVAPPACLGTTTILLANQFLSLFVHLLFSNIFGAIMLADHIIRVVMRSVWLFLFFIFVVIFGFFVNKRGNFALLGRLSLLPSTGVFLFFLLLLIFFLLVVIVLRAQIRVGSGSLFGGWLFFLFVRRFFLFVVIVVVFTARSKVLTWPEVFSTSCRHVCRRGLLWVCFAPTAVVLVAFFSNLRKSTEDV